MGRFSAFVPLVLAASLGASVVAYGASGSAAGRPACTVLAARAGILSSNLPRRVKLDAGGKYGGGVDKLICRDFTRDGRKDMVATVLSGGTAATEAWVLFRAKKQGWKLAFRRTGLYKAGVKAKGRAVVESDPVFQTNDQNCCPTGGYDHRRYSWRRGRMQLAHTWHTG
jgi:hypothetical protein